MENMAPLLPLNILNLKKIDSKLGIDIVLALIEKWEKELSIVNEKLCSLIKQI